MKICLYCGVENTDQVNKCGSCGATAFKEKCNNCGNVFSTGKYCPNCGVRAGAVTKTCPDCGCKYFSFACPDCGYTVVKRNDVPTVNEVNSKTIGNEHGFNNVNYSNKSTYDGVSPSAMHQNFDAETGKYYQKPDNIFNKTYNHPNEDSTQSETIKNSFFGGNKDKSSAIAPKKKRRGMGCIWALGWVFFFPIPLFIVLKRNNKIPTIFKVFIFLFACSIYFSLVNTGNA